MNFGRVQMIHIFWQVQVCAAEEHMQCWSSFISRSSRQQDRRTVLPVDLLTTMVENAIIDFAVENFKKDWIKTYGDKKIYEL